MFNSYNKHILLGPQRRKILEAILDTVVEGELGNS